MTESNVSASSPGFFLRLVRKEEPVRFLGECWDSEDVLGCYQQASNVEEFLAYAVKSSGDWLLYDAMNGLLVTAPGFSGCYLDESQKAVARDIGPLVENRLKQDQSVLDQSASSWWLSRAINVSIFCYPVSSPFLYIRSLVGATVVHFDGETLKCEGYLDRAGDESYPVANLEHSLMEAASRVQKPVRLMFSGGKDCLSIAMALRESGFDSSNLRLVYVSSGCLGRDKELNLAKLAARSTGCDLEFVQPEDRWWAWGGIDGADRLLQLMARTIVEPMAQLHCIPDIGQDELLIDGQNMDAMLSVDMRKPPQNWPSIFGSPIFWYLYVFRDVLRNLRYTNHFQRSGLMRSSIYRLEKVLKSMYRFTGVLKSFDAAPVDRMQVQELVAALQRKVPPGSIDPNLDFDWDFLKLEADRLIELGGGRINDSWFYMYPAMATMLGHGQDTNVHRFLNQGPFTPLWRRDVPVREAISPKFEIRRFLKKKLGKPYAATISGWEPSAIDLGEIQHDGEASGLSGFRDLFNWKDSAVMDHLGSSTADRMKSDLEKIVNIDECSGKSLTHQMERKIRFRQGVRFLNLECILRGQGS